MRKPLLFPLALLLSVALQAQLAPSFNLFEPIGDILYTIGMDVDGDGDDDVICATNERLFWQAQLEPGVFSKLRLIANSELTYRSLVAADIDEDGDDDLVYASNEAGVGVHLNLGGGELGPAVEIYNPGVVIDCYLDDLNGDDHLDIVTASPSEIRRLIGNGNGGFSSAQLISDDHATTTCVHTEDLDNDGDQDLLVAALLSDRLAWHENLGNGQFADYQVIDTLDGPGSVATADFDGDGLMDLVCAYRQEEDEIGAGLVHYRNLGNGEFAPGDTLMSRGWHNFVHVEDLDQDGDMDIISCHGLDEMDWLANDGEGNFSEAIKLENYAAYLRFVDTPDLNSDGYPDLLYGINSTSPQKENVLWRASTGDGQFEPPALVMMGARNLGIPQLGDFDQDGLMDIVIGSEGTDALVWFRNEGSAYSLPRLIARRHNYDPFSIAVADINNDGWPDILAGNIQGDLTNPSYYCFYMNDGDGSFTAGPPFQTYYYPQREMELVDVDHDGDLDMLYGNPGYNATITGHVGWVRNDGDSWSEPITLLPDLINVYDILTTDMDQDGQMEIIVSMESPPHLGRMEHTGNGNYTALEGVSGNFTETLHAEVVDVDGDGLPDLMASAENTSVGGDQIAWWRNLGNGILGPQQTIYEGGPPIEKFLFEDFDLDGRKDIIASTYFDFPMQVLLQQADGSFNPPVTIQGTPQNVRGFHLRDLDSDGDWDIIGNGVDDDPYGGIDNLFVAYNLANDESISGIVFHDLNSNGQQDAEEEGIGSIPIEVTPAALAVFADNQGRFSIYGASGEYTISPQLEECWTLTTNPAAYEVAFDGSAGIDSLRFGIASNTDMPEAAVSLASAPTRCGFTVPFWLNYRNDGCWPFDGEVYLVLNELADFVSAEPAPSHTSGDTLFWSFSTLAPGTSRSVDLMMTIAGVEFLGSSLSIATGLIPYNGMGQALPAETFDFLSIINCAYDPNDKQVHPNRAEQAPFTQNYTLFDETLLYTLRFQNTGTDTAFNIVLRDQLSPALDWTTFRPGSSSHPYDATLHEDGLLEFHFRDILLPDSTTNEPGSHGFVQFEIQALSDLEDGESIDNTAGIYFDFNPPIITNTVNSMMVESLPNFSPAAGFEYSAADLTVGFTDISSNNPDTWLWEFGDGNTSPLQHPTHTYDAPGDYQVCLTASNDWGSSQYCEQLMLIVDTDDIPGERPAVYLHPNPARETVLVQYAQGALPQHLTLYNAYGQVVQEITIREQSTSWDISELPAGSYWMQSDQGSVQKLVVVR